MTPPTERILQEVLVESRGGAARTGILHALLERPRNAHRLAKDLDFAYKTIRHHLDVLTDRELVRCSGDNYGAVYLPSERATHHRARIEGYWQAMDAGEDSS